jgi:hypothetical protein
MTNEKVGRGAQQFPLRLPEGMRDRIRAAAGVNNRSMNSEIVATLQEKYPAPALDGLTCTDIRRLKGLVSHLGQADLDAKERLEVSGQINFILEGGFDPDQGNSSDDR